MAWVWLLAWKLPHCQRRGQKERKKEQEAFSMCPLLEPFHCHETKPGLAYCGGNDMEWSPRHVKEHSKAQQSHLNTYNGSQVGYYHTPSHSHSGDPQTCEMFVTQHLIATGNWYKVYRKDLWQAYLQDKLKNLLQENSSSWVKEPHIRASTSTGGYGRKCFARL